MNPAEKHREQAIRHLRVRIVTVSSSRYAKKESGEKYSDESGDAAEEETKRAGHAVAARSLVSDDEEMLRGEVQEFLAGKDDILLMTGGTGISRRDITIETVKPYFEKELEGFGELVRKLGYDEIGSAAMLSRATAGIAKGKIILCMPGSPAGVMSAMKAFLGELPHAVFIARS
jgi:molybdopterin adenylyltransferase